MELTRDAIALVRAWYALPENERTAILQHVETASLQYRKTVPAEAMSPNWRRPGPRASKGGEAAAAKRVRKAKE